MQNDPNKSNKTRQIIAIAIMAALVVLVIVGFLVGPHSNKTTSKSLTSNDYHDKNSGQTLSDPPDKAPDTFGVTANTPTYLGLGDLLDSMSIYQLDALKKAFYSYANSKGRNITEISVTAGSITSPDHDPTQDYDVVNFTVLFNRKTLVKATVHTSNIDTIQLFLYDTKTNALLFDSGALTSDSVQ